MDPIIFTTTIFQVYALHYVLEILGGMGEEWLERLEELRKERFGS